MVNRNKSRRNSTRNSRNSKKAITQKADSHNVASERFRKELFESVNKPDDIEEAEKHKLENSVSKGNKTKKKVIKPKTNNNQTKG